MQNLSHYSNINDFNFINKSNKNCGLHIINRYILFYYFEYILIKKVCKFIIIFPFLWGFGVLGCSLSKVLIRFDILSKVML
jgi:hypothetical protein